MFPSLAKEEGLHMRILRAGIDSLGQTGFWFDMQEFPPLPHFILPKSRPPPRGE